MNLSRDTLFRYAAKFEGYENGFFSSGTFERRALVVLFHREKEQKLVLLVERKIVLYGEVNRCVRYYLYKESFFFFYFI